MKKLLKVSAVLAILTGVILVAGSLWAICFIYNTVSNEKIVTPQDAAIPGKPVRGPFTLHAQAEIIREHTLKITGGKTYAEMPREVAKIGADGKPALDVQGKPVMMPNAARDIWITATTLTTALHLGILTYVFSGLILLFGLVSLWTGIVFYKLSRVS